MRVRLADGYLLWFVVAHPYQPTLRLSPNPLDVPGIDCHRELSCLTPAQTGVDETVRFAGVVRNPCLDELKSFRRLGAELIRSEIFKQDFTFGGFARINRAFRPRFNRDRLAPSFLWEYIKPPSAEPSRSASITAVSLAIGVWFDDGERLQFNGTLGRWALPPAQRQVGPTAQAGPAPVSRDNHSVESPGSRF